MNKELYTYDVYINGWNGTATITVQAADESDAIHQALTIDGAPWASVYEVERR